MKILVTGRGTSGSWKVRGEQLGQAIGATVIADCIDVEHYDLAVMVKRPSQGLVQRLQNSGVPFVWDVVDAYPQPIGNKWTKLECMRWLMETLNLMEPTGIVGATRAMTWDCVDMKLPSLWLPHHARPGLQINPIREKIRTVGYEGSEHYLGKWRRVLEAECARRGWTFVVNPNHLTDLDIVVAFREDTGYAPQYWKSNVKLANAQGSGTPFIGCTECGYTETTSGAELFVNYESELALAFDTLTPQYARQMMSVTMLRSALHLKNVAEVYLEWLQRVKAGHDEKRRNLQG